VKKIKELFDSGIIRTRSQGHSSETVNPEAEVKYFSNLEHIVCIMNTFRFLVDSKWQYVDEHKETIVHWKTERLEQRN